MLVPLLTWFSSVPSHYSYQALIVNEFSDAVFVCTNSSATCVPTGNVHLQNIGFQSVVIWHWALVLAGMIVGYRLLAYLVLRFVQKEKR